MAATGVNAAELEDFRRDFMQGLVNKRTSMGDEESEPDLYGDDEVQSSTRPQVQPKPTTVAKTKRKAVPKQRQPKTRSNTLNSKSKSAQHSPKTSQSNRVGKKSKITNTTKSKSNPVPVAQHSASGFVPRGQTNPPRSFNVAAGNSQGTRPDTAKSRSQTQPKATARKFIIGIDYGTTFTSVSYYSHDAEDDDPQPFPEDVKSIHNWPNDPMKGVNKQVPTESWYPNVTLGRLPTKQQFDVSDSEDEGDIATPASIYEEQDDETSQPTGQTASQMDDERSTTYLWGYTVPYQSYVAHTQRNENRLVRRPKLMLVDSAHTKQDRVTLRPILNHLIQHQIIRKFGSRTEESVRDVQDVISDFLIQILRHTKKQLVINERFTLECSVSFVLTVPSVWCPNSSRVLQNAMEIAIKASNFCRPENGGIEDLFLISEPEAAATYLLGTSDSMTAGDTFVVLDCGGVTNSYPMRLNKEVVKPNGDNCGASYLNINYEQHLLRRLANEHYLEDNGDTRESIVRDTILAFENYDKRSVDLTCKPAARVKIPNLRGDKRQGLSVANAKRFENNYVLLNFNDYDEIFLPLLKRVAKVLRGQLDSAYKKKREVKKVFLIGGFGAAPSLRSYLLKFLSNYEDETGRDVELVKSDEQTCVTAVASGAVLRAINKEQGPQRSAYSSYGFLRWQPHEPRLIPGHQKAATTIDEFDGEKYVRAIAYFMLKGQIVPPVHSFTPFRCFHKFDVDEPKFLCEEVLYVSDKATSSDYPLDSNMNRDAQVAGKIIVDMFFLREQNLILPTFPHQDDNGDTVGKVHYLVEYDLVPIVEGRSLRYEARYPPGIAGKVQQAGQVSIAAAFRAGTA